MTALQWAGFSASILIGMSLGLMGGGGSILTLPVLVYLLGLHPILSTVYSLFVVGMTSLVGSVSYMRRQHISYKAAVLFSIPSFLAVYLTRRYLLPLIPDPLMTTATFVLRKDMALMLLFGGVMLAASVGMIRHPRLSDRLESQPVRFNIPVIVLDGILVGLLTGLVGAGGGFMIIPVLVVLIRLPMKTAVGTSLLIIAANTLIGFRSGAANLTIDWPFLLTFTSLSILGSLLGTYLSRFIAGHKLKSAFGWFVLVVGMYIISRELLV